MQSRHGSLESAILSALWGLEKSEVYTNSVKDVFDILSKNDLEKRAYTTIKTVMDRLHEKKVLMRYKQGKKFYYRTMYTSQETIKMGLTELSNRYCGGDLQQLNSVLNSILDENSLISV